MRRTIATIAALLLVAGPVSSRAVAVGEWQWPVTGPILRGFDPPDSPYGSGHRGIDVGALPGTTVAAPAGGVVTFAGPVGGRLFLTIDHGQGLESTYSWLDELLVRRGDAVVAGQPVAVSGWGHTGSSVPHLHLGARLDDAYVDPLVYLGPVTVSGFVRLAPLPA